MEPTDASTDAELERFLNGRDVACPGCGYNLRGIKAAACPECGEALHLECVGARAQRRMTTLHLMPPAMAVGGCGVIVWLSVVQSARDWIRGNFRISVDLDPQQLWPAWIGLVLAVVWLTAAYRWKGQISQNRTGRQAAAAWLVCTGVVMGVAGVIALVD